MRTKKLGFGNFLLAGFVGGLFAFAPHAVLAFILGLFVGALLFIGDRGAQDDYSAAPDGTPYLRRFLIIAVTTSVSIWAATISPQALIAARDEAMRIKAEHTLYVVKEARERYMLQNADTPDSWNDLKPFIMVNGKVGPDSPETMLGGKLKFLGKGMRIKIAGIDGGKEDKITMEDGEEIKTARSHEQ